MKPEDKIKELINKSDAKTTTGVDKKILAGASEHLEKLRQKNLAAGGAGTIRQLQGQGAPGGAGSPQGCTRWQVHRRHGDYAHAVG